jgi:hypothetical protein
MRPEVDGSAYHSYQGRTSGTAEDEPEVRLPFKERQRSLHILEGIS